MRDEYDYVVAGAGPAGLSAAVELSANPQFRGLIMERGEIGKSSKAWADYADKIKAAGLGNTILHVSKEIVQNSFLGTNISITSAYEGYASLDDKLLLETLRRRINPAHCDVAEGCEFFAFRYDKNRVILTTSRGEMSTRLLIDATGYKSNGKRNDTKSPVVNTYKLQDNTFFLQTFSYVLKNSNVNQNRAVLMDVNIPTEYNSWFWIEPLGDRKVAKGAWVGAAYLLKEKEFYDWDTVREDTKRYMRSKKMEGDIDSEKLGFIPSCNFQKSVFDNILLVGDSAAHAGAGMYFGLSLSMRNGLLAARVAREGLESGRLDEAFLSSYEKLCYDNSNKLNNLLGVIGEKIVSPARYTDLEKILKNFKNWDRDIIERRIRFELTKQDIKDIASRSQLGLALRLIPLRDYPALIKDVAKMLKEIYL